MMCPCGGQVHSVTCTLKTREALLEWFPNATDHPLPAKITVRACWACGRLDKHIVRQQAGEGNMQMISAKKRG